MRTILIADDNRLSRELLRDVLDGAGHRVVEARDGGEALRLIEEQAPDLVLLDLEMPVKNGYAVLECIQAHPRFSKTPVVAVTAKAMRNDREKAVGAGFSAYLAKPVRAADLRRLVEQLLLPSGKGADR
jgi:two-component system cell cycle response regulator DivK